MFDIDKFLTRCQEALAESEPCLAVTEVVERAMRRPEQVARALPATRAQIVPLYASDELSVVNVIWSPGMSFRPHNHLMWVAIGLYGGQEDNTFYRRRGDRIVLSGRRQLRAGDVALLGDHTIHAVSNPRRSFTGAIHVYGGHHARHPGRSEWDENTLEETDYDFDRVKRRFADTDATGPPEN
jgi:predicted metal-dependent enzyme (double-stranded beta helix superfamily)